eukprot:c51663_g1_i1 orf=40-207(+)
MVLRVEECLKKIQKHISEFLWNKLGLEANFKLTHSLRSGQGEIPGYNVTGNLGEH